MYVMNETPRNRKEPDMNRQGYAWWYYNVLSLCDETLPELDNSEDLRDAVEGIYTLMTFLPNPRNFDPPLVPVPGNPETAGNPLLEIQEG
jgi:hypothetical protein